MKYRNSIFVSGSAGFGKGKTLTISDPSHIPDILKARLDGYMAQGKLFLIGDCIGVDSAIQAYLARKGYKYVCVYHAGPRIRHKAIDAWPHQEIAAPPGVYGRAFYELKDIAMREDCESALAIWDGASTGTKRNIAALLEMGKHIEIYRLDLKRFKPDISQNNKEDGNG